MLKYIIRLDDACPYMDIKKWNRVEFILDKYNIRPIVGIIPAKWQKKGWIIAQHGLHHDLNKEIRTEYSGKSFNEQKNNLIEGNEILNNYKIKPVCFFAPAHTFDDNTVKACVELGYFKFISDGVSLYPFKSNNMIFLPNIFDTPHKILPFGVYTFVLHPNNMSEDDFLYLEKFIINNKDNFEVTIDELLKKYSNRKRTIFDFIIKYMIFILRKVRK